MQISSEILNVDNRDFVCVMLNDEILTLVNQNLIKEFISGEIGKGSKYFILDLKEVNTINSSGLGILISILNKVKESGGILKIRNLSDRIKQIFSITRLNLIFEID
ncbi:MAG: STAS domain-containing protein [Ignavibacteria bacterium]|nr:STAS domain-containing protein [Ignavibacteria bacterium]